MSARGRVARLFSYFRPRVEVLEDRRLPSASAQFVNPADNDAQGLDKDPRAAVVWLEGATVSDFRIKLNQDVNGPAIDDATVTADSVTLTRNGATLRQGRDYTQAYDANEDTIRLVPLAGVWGQGIYSAVLDNSASGIRDLSGQPLGPNQPDGSTRFTVGLDRATTAPVAFFEPIDSPRQTAVDSVMITFSEAVTGFDLDDLQLTAGNSSNFLTDEATLTTADNVTWTLGNLTRLTDPSGRVVRLTLRLRAAGSGIVAAATSAPLTGDATASMTLVAPVFQLTGTTLTVPGRTGNDYFEFEYSAGSLWRLTLNGRTYGVDSLAVSAVVFQGNGGRDRAYLAGWPGPDAFVSVPRDRRASLTTRGVVAHVRDVEIVYANGIDGNDRATFYDTAGNDRFIARPGSANLRGTGFSAFAHGFRTVVAYATAGADDAYLYGTAGNDVFVGRPTYSSLKGGGWASLAKGFDLVYAYGYGGTDVAYFYDSAGNDTFLARASYGYLQGRGFSNRASGFEKYYGYATAGGHDVAYLHDSAGSDTFRGSRTVGYLYGPGYLRYTKGFDRLFVHGTGVNRKSLSGVNYVVSFVGVWI